MRIETELDGKTVGAIERHYLHAKEKHPYFCDALLYGGWTRDNLVRKLEEDRMLLKGSERDGKCTMAHIMSCEVSEMTVEIIDGNNAAAVEEAYDAIAVLLRTIDVLEGRQALGKPKEEGAAK